MQQPHIVLIHGAWQGSWAFDVWRPYLEQAGWQVHAVNLPGNGYNGTPDKNDLPIDLKGYTACVVDLLNSLDAPAVVVGHSGGGITASQVAEAAPDQVRALVYLAGMMLPNGVGLDDIISECFAADTGFEYIGVMPYLQWSDDQRTSSVPADTALSMFLHDCPADIAAAAASKLTPQLDTGRDMLNRLTAERFGQVPRVYVECTNDRSITLPLQRRMQNRTPGAHRITLECGHVPQVACPKQLTDSLLPVLEKLSESSKSLDTENR